MNWIELLAAVGAGAIFTKVIDIVWLQKVMRNHERDKWLRNEKLAAYSELSKLILSFGKESEVFKDPFKGHAISARAILLITDESLIKDIRVFIDGVNSQFKQHQTSGSKDGLDVLINQSQSIIEQLREDLRK
ncbi:hypothetical protein A6E13_19640 [Aliivibrio fischeri]|uniref:hypothetical protein n=1 Tax=Aliivibrio fischeri TaxID=668 RepID=UPI00080ED21C|nr:hypothetical protein [Aliivibrio fischeri]OCH29855.1 hypothetical protein A6E13_19640 [Aliivibrio fischeri]